MNHYAQYELKLTQHAYLRYKERVGTIDRNELNRWCNDNIQAQNYRVRNKNVQIDDVWFGMRKNEKRQRLYLTTCLGRSHLDLPEAIVWAKRHDDRINLQHLTQGLNGGYGR